MTASLTSFADYHRLKDPAVLQEHLERIIGGLESDPAAAIGSSKELVESTCKLVLDDFGANYKQSDDLQELYKKAAKELRLTRSSVPRSAKGSGSAKKTLQALVTAVQGLAELRNELGSGHGRTEPSPARARHARLAFGSARTIAEFLLDTWHARFELIHKIATAESFNDARKHIAELRARPPLSDVELGELVLAANTNFQVYGAHEYSPQSVGGRLWEIVSGREKVIPGEDLDRFRENFSLDKPEPDVEDEIPF